MTGTASSRGRIFLDFDSYRNQEWLRRRKLRLEQVRKQTNDLAKTLRQKAVDEDKTRSDEYERLNNARFRDWKAEKLHELEEKLRCALEEFGQGYREAEEEPNPDEVIEERNKINQKKAQKRGERAQQEEIRRRKMEEERKKCPIERKRMTRKVEDLRSALIRSVLIKKQSEAETQSEEFQKKTTTVMKKKVNKPHQISSVKKMTVKKVKKKKSCDAGCKQCGKKSESVSPSKDVNTVWVNLNDIQASSDVGSYHRSCGSCSSVGRPPKENGEGVVEFFDYPSRCYSKTFRNLPTLVERIDSESQPNANELARIEEENEKIEAQRKVDVDAVTQERGLEALRREKITRDYNDLIAKLEELHKKEKIIKAQHRIPPSLVHMNDERLSERMRTRQRMMDSKFESIYYEAAAAAPRPEPQRSSPLDHSGGGDYVDPTGGTSPRLSFSPSNLKTNSPISPERQSPLRTSPDDFRRPKSSPNKKQLLSDVDRALREGRHLRETISRKSSAVEKSPTSEETKSPESSPGKPEKMTKSQESQTEDAIQVEVKSPPRDVENRATEDSLPLSSSTSYKSPPSVIRSCRLRQFLEYLEGLSESEETDLRNDPKFKRRVKKLLTELQEEPTGHRRIKNSSKNPSQSRALEYYVEKLLDMSRECVANLSVSSENISTPNITDLDLRNEDEVDSKSAVESEQSRGVFSRGEDLIRRSRLNRAEKLEEAIKNWKTILERNAQANETKEEKDEPDFPQERFAEEEEKGEMEVLVLHSPKVKNRYEEISKKCSERIWELSNMLEKVRKDKQKLLSSSSGGSSLCLSKTQSEDFLEEELEEIERRLEPKTSPVLESFINRYSLSRPSGGENASTMAVVDSQSCQETNESLESWPDVMDELLRREIITSPFKWSDGEFSSEMATVNEDPKPSSIETLIGNFRKEMSRIRPFSLSSGEEHVQTRMHRSTRYSFPEFQEDASISSPRFQEESSVESINHALTSLGLNWAKSFLKKNEESKAITSSSGSSDDGTSSAEEEERFLCHRKTAE